VPRNVREWIAVLWPAFVAAAVLEMLVFAAFDPHDFNAFGLSIDHASDAIYSISFFAFWAITAAAGVVTWSLSRTSDDVNRDGRQVDPLAASAAATRKALQEAARPPSVPPGAA
jgi:hypothetical protein